ncbi:MAG: ATP phosphoribosyltransferase [Clostridiales bacterium]|jgi:ATP phosphoribosyltransferase|nr:ATP phosphoribosyltransferase [Clostridiales bacterium]
MTDFIRVALPKGRLGEKVYTMFDKAGYPCPELMEDNRKLVLENAEKGIRYFWVKPSDVAVYVQRGAADLGVAGSDVLVENAPDVYELLDLKVGICQMVVAAPVTWEDTGIRALRVACKYPRIAARYFEEKGRDIDIIMLNGSVEIAPLLGLSDVIVDIVETGKTLKENGLHVVENILPISARLIAGKTSYQFRHERILEMCASLKAVVEGQT